MVGDTTAESMTTRPDKPDAPNPAIASRFQVGLHGRGFGEPGRRRGTSDPNATDFSTIYVAT